MIECALAHDPGVESKGGRWGPLGVLIEDLVAGRQFSGLLDAQIRLSTSLIAIGAPVGAYYPEIARRLGAPLVVPEHAAVCNAVGAVAGVVSETCEVLVNQTTFKVFRVHDPAGSRDYPEESDAIDDAKRVSQELALAAARRAGAIDPHVETSVSERGRTRGLWTSTSRRRLSAPGRLDGPQRGERVTKIHLIGGRKAVSVNPSSLGFWPNISLTTSLAFWVSIRIAPMEPWSVSIPASPPRSHRSLREPRCHCRGGH